MKQKIFDKKLILNKRTIATLDSRQIKGVHGGILPRNTPMTCPHRCPECETGDMPTCPPPPTEDPTVHFPICCH